MQTNVNKNRKAEVRADYKKTLVSGDLIRIAELSNVNTATVWRFFHNQSDNADVERAYHLLMEKKEQDIQERLKNL